MPISVPESSHPVRPPFYGWRLVAVLWVILLINLAFPMYGASVMNTYMAREMHLDSKMLGFGYTLFMIAIGLPGPLVAASINRFGARATLVAGNLMVFVGSVLLATVVHDGISAALVFGIIVGGGVISGGLLASQTLIARWFERHRTRALAFAFTANGVGGFIAPPLLNKSVEYFGAWQAGWWVVGILSLGAALLAALFVREFPSDRGQVPDGTVQSQPLANVSLTASAEWSFRSAIRTPAFWIIVYCGAAFNSALAFIITYTIAHMRNLGVAPGAAALTLASVALGSLFGKVALGVVGARVPVRISWVAALACLGLGLLLAINASRIAGLYPFALIAGLGVGANLVCLSSLPAELFGRKPFASLMGLSLTVQTIASATVPLAAGAIFDRTGSYAPSMILIAAACGVGAILLLVMRTPRLKTA